MPADLLLWLVFVFSAGVYVGQLLAAVTQPRTTFAMAPGETKTVTTTSGMEITVSAR